MKETIVRTAKRYFWIPVLGAIGALLFLALPDCQQGFGNIGDRPVEPYIATEPPIWTPEGSEIVLAAQGNLYRVAADGSAVQIISHSEKGQDGGAHSPSLSPAGDRVVYSREPGKDPTTRGEDYELFIIKLDGSDEFQLTNNQGRDMSPVWSPDGSRIVYKGYTPDAGPGSLLTIAPDGSNITDIAPGMTTVGETLPAWSPDGSYIAFAGTEKPEQGTGPMSIYTVKNDGSELTKVTGAAYSAPAWSPDGKRLWFIGVRNPSSHHPQLTVNTVNRDGTGLTEEFVSGYDESFPHGNPDPPSWSPDGLEVLFGGDTLTYANLETGEVRYYRLSKTGGTEHVNFSTPVWSPDGTRLVAVIEPDLSGRPEVLLSHLITMRPDGTDKRLIMGWQPETFDAVAGLGQAWSPPSGISWQWTDVSAHPCPEASGCAQRNVSDTSLFHKTPTGAGFDYEPPVHTLEELLEKGLAGGGASPTHIAVRGTADEESTRCDRRSVARTPAQREQAIRFWLNLDDDEDLPSPEEAKRTFNSYIDTADAAFRPTLKASFTPLAEGGMTDNYQFLICYVDYTVAEYLLGTGPDKITVAYDNRIGEATLSYELYKEAYDSGYYGEQERMTQAEYRSAMDQAVLDAETALAEILQSRGAVVFLSPLAAHHAIAVEAWQVIAQWDLQTNDENELLAVRYGAAENHPEYSQTLANLKSRVATAAASDSQAGMRIASASGLTQYYRSIGAYGDITLDDNSTDTFTPVQPIPIQACTGSTAVGTTRTLGIIRDCSALLDLKAALAGTAMLNWSADLAIAGWTGVTTSGTPKRVTSMSLPSSGLNGAAPAGLERLQALTTLDLSGNSLTGRIPASLRELSNLSTLRLSGNSLSGCIPSALREVTTNDLASVGLPYCDMLAPPPAPTGVNAAVADGTFTITWDEVSGAAKYEAQHRATETDDLTALPETETASTTHSPEGGLACGTTYRFQVRAFGDGVMHSEAWGALSAEVSHTSEACNQAPDFGSDSYSFEVDETTSAGSLIGTVATTDVDEGDVVYYSIIAGNEDGQFAIDDETGEITLASALDQTLVSSYPLTVRAEDGNGGENTANVEVTVSSVCRDGTVIPNPGDNPDQVGDCLIL